MAEKPVTDAVLADWLGVSDRMVRDLAERDLVVKVGRNRYGLKASVQRYAANIRATAAGRSAEGDIDLVTERALLARQQRIGQEIKNDLATGSVVPLDDVIAGVTAQNHRVRNKLLAIPAEVAPRAAVLKSADEVRALIEDEIVQALQELTDGREDVSLDQARAEFSERYGEAAHA